VTTYQPAPRQITRLALIAAIARDLAILAAAINYVL
jgi:hypothetical protein